LKVNPKPEYIDGKVRNNVSTSNLITKTVYHILFYFARKF